MDDKELDNLFAAARAAPPVPSAALMDRVMADALASQPAPRPAAARPPAQALPPRRRPFWEPLAALFGGTGALVGMGGAAAMGLFIGLAQPAVILSVSDAYLGGTLDSVALLPSVDALFPEVTE